MARLMARRCGEEPCCGCVTIFFAALTFLWAAVMVVESALATVRSIEKFFSELIDAVKAWWIALIHTPYFNLSTVCVAALAIGLMLGWALAFRTRLP